MIGIYRILNMANGKCYIGQSTNIHKRWSNHRVAAFNKSGEQYNYPLYCAMRKYGLSNFKFEVCEECKASELNEKEHEYIVLYNACDNGYNQTVGGDYSITNCKLTVEEVLEIQDKLLTQNYTLRDLANEYKVHPDTIRDINNGTSWSRLRDDLIYPLYISYSNKDYKPEARKCPICGGVKDRSAQFCHKCVRKATNNSRRPSREELKNKIRVTPFAKLGVEYGITDNAVRKWCKFYGLPFRSQEIKLYSDEQWKQL